jgi:hypothetical protein
MTIYVKVRLDLMKVERRRHGGIEYSQLYLELLSLTVFMHTSTPILTEKSLRTPNLLIHWPINSYLMTTSRELDNVITPMMCPMSMVRITCTLISLGILLTCQCMKE